LFETSLKNGTKGGWFDKSAKSVGLKKMNWASSKRGKKGTRKRGVGVGYSRKGGPREKWGKKSRNDTRLRLGG